MSSGRKGEEIRKKSRLISENDIADSRRRSTPGRAAKTTEQFADRTGSKTERISSPGSRLSSELFPEEFLNFQFHEYLPRARARERDIPCPKWLLWIPSMWWIFLSRARLISRALGRRRIEKSPIPLKVQRISGARVWFSPASRHDLKDQRPARLNARAVS